MPDERLNGQLNKPSSPLIDALRRTQPWMTFFSILFFISTGLLSIAFIFSLVVLFFPGGTILPGYWNAVIPVIYLALAGVYFLFGWKIRSVTHSIKAYLEQPETKRLSGFIEKNHSMWQFFGTVTLCLILLQMALIVIALGISFWVNT